MKVKDILSYFDIDSSDEKDILSVSDNSSTKKINWIYFNLSSKEHAKEYIEEAKRNAAYLIISIHNIDGVIYCKNLKQNLNRFLIDFYKFERKFKLIGITGTNGKSSLSNFLKQSLLLNNNKVKNVVCVKEDNSYKANNTTPDSFKLFEIFKKANRQKLDFLIVEISSIGINEGRVNNINFDYLFLTNISSDHLDYHKSLKEYVKTKIEYIETSNAIKFIDNNIDKNIIKNYKYINEDYNITLKNGKHTLFINNKIINNNLIFKTNLINLSFCYYFLKEIKVKNYKQILSKIHPYKGRLDIVNYNPLIVIDYAHTASSFENIINECKILFNKKLILVFGSGGDRDISKRREYAEIANKYHAYSIVTMDNPRTEKPDKIIEDITLYLENYEVIESRKLAIKRGIDLLDSNKMLLILGKGNEDFILMNGIKLYHNDYIEVEKCLAKRI